MIDDREFCGQVPLPGACRLFSERPDPVRTVNAMATVSAGSGRYAFFVFHRDFEAGA